MARTINLKSRHDEVERRLVQLIGIRIADRNTTQIESAHRCDTRPVCRSFRAAIVFLFCFFFVVTEMTVAHVRRCLSTGTTTPQHGAGLQPATQ